MEKIGVSVIMITYGHQNYIEEAIRGVYMQKTNFSIELIIADDSSPDETSMIVKKLLEESPEKVTVKYTRHKKNKGVSPNFFWALQQAQGKYIAICEGDDYWSDPLKLQQQVDFLEKNRDYVLCFSNRDILNNGKIEMTQPLYGKTSFQKSEISNIYVPTLTAVFRNVVSRIPARMQASLIDCSLFLFLSQHGSFYYLNKSTAVYRVHSEGVYSGSSAVMNYKRSVSARITAWKYLKEVDKISLSHTISFLIGEKKEAELRDKKYLSALKSSGLGFFFDIFILLQLFQEKVKKLF